MHRRPVAVGEFARALDFLAAAEQSDDIDALQERMRRAFLEFGVTHFSMIALASVAGSTSRFPIGLIRGCSQEWSQRYRSQYYYNFDPVVHKAMKQTAPFAWAEVERRPLAKEAIKMFEECREHLKNDNAYVIPTHDAHGFAGLITLFHKERGFRPQTERALKLMAIYAIERAKELHGLKVDGEGWAAECPLTARQRELLSFAALGKSDWDVGQIVGLSEKTVNHHFERAKQSIGVRTRTQAVAIAVHRGWVVI
jgi:LuxR family quorum sensing-dependent transcriptional regulator